MGFFSKNFVVTTSDFRSCSTWTAYHSVLGCEDQYKTKYISDFLKKF